VQRNSFCSRADVAGELHRAGTALVLPHSLQRVGLHVRDAAFLFEPRASPLPVGPAADFIRGSTGELPPVRDIWGHLMPRLIVRCALLIVRPFTLLRGRLLRPLSDPLPVCRPASALHASFPRSVALTQLRFASISMI